MEYLSFDECKKDIFPFIHQHLTHEEPAPAYEAEARGVEELKKVLTFVQDNMFYETFAEKAAYLLCSITGSQYFSNGNKRVGVGVLLFFLGINDATLESLDDNSYEALLKQSFPNSQWDPNQNIPDAHALFLYNLAIVIGDRTQWGGASYQEVKQRVTNMFAHLYSVDEKGTT